MGEHSQTSMDDNEAYLVAIPLHLANRFNAMRSPRSRYLAFPLTVATCLTGSNTSASWICHSTLLNNQALQSNIDPENHSRTAQLLEDLCDEGRPCEDSRLLALPEQVSFTFYFTNNISSIIKGGCVFCQPGSDLGFPARRQKMGIRWGVGRGRCHGCDIGKFTLQISE